MSTLLQKRSRGKREWDIPGLLSVKENLFHRGMLSEGIFFPILSWVVSAAEPPSRGEPLHHGPHALS